MSIIALSVNNFKRIKAVNISPDGRIVQITGRNAQGKSSLLDAIKAVLCGEKECPDKPVRSGEKQSKIVAKLLNDLIVTRTFSDDGKTSLTVSNAQGARYPSPQAVLDKLFGKMLDPVAFMKMDDKKQLETLRLLVGLDFSKLDGDRATAYFTREGVNRDLKSATANMLGCPEHTGVPEQEISVSELMRKLEAGQAINDKKRFLEEKRARQHHKEMQAEIASVQELKAKLRHAEEMIVAYQKDIVLQDAELATAKSVNLSTINEEIRSSDSVNARVRDNRRRAELGKKCTAFKDRSEELTATIENIDDEKANLLSTTTFPISGLSFNENGVTYNGEPFAQCSQAERLRISVAIGLAMKPELPVILVREGSLLDSDGLKILSELAEQYKAQVWLEKCTDGENVGIVIEDGIVVSDPADAQG